MIAMGKGAAEKMSVSPTIEKYAATTEIAKAVNNKSIVNIMGLIIVW
jgi:hypothetical protein